MGDRSEDLDESLLRHRGCLGGEHRVAVGLVDEEAVRSDRVAVGERVGVEHPGRRRALVVADVAATTERHHHLAVPGGLLTER